MSIEAQATTPTPETTVPASELSFADYTKLRREGGSIESALTAKVEQKETPKESDPEETEEEAEQLDADESEKDSEADKPKHKKKSGFQRRVDNLNAKVSKAEQERDYWRELASKEKEAKEQPKSEKTEIKVDGKPDPDKFDTHAEYVEALTDWKIEQREKSAQEKSELAKRETAERDLIKTYAEREKAFSEKTEDYKETLESVDDVKLPNTIKMLIVESEVGPQLAYELAKNRSELERICDLSPIAAAREIGKIESKISANYSEEKKPEVKKLTSASKPIEPISGSKGSSKKAITDPDISFAEYVKQRREQQKRRA